MRWPGAYGYLFRMRKAWGPRVRTWAATSSEPVRAVQKTQPGGLELGGEVAPTYAIRQGAQRRFTPAGHPSRVHELSQALAHLEERHTLLGYVDARSRLGIPPLARVAVADTEAAEAAQLDLVALGERVGDVVEDRVDDRLRLLLGEVGELGDLVDQIGFRHRPLRSPPSVRCRKTGNDPAGT